MKDEGGKESRPLVKICGLTRPADAELAVALGADLVGLNLWPGSSRCVSPSAARDLADRVRDRTRIVGIFVDEDPDVVARLRDEIGLDLLQFHGDESPAAVERFGDRALKALRIRDRIDLDELSRYDSAWGFLVERRHATGYGGTGESWDYTLVREISIERPILVAGGIGPGGAAAALERSGADGIDVCSGVERSPGVKDRELMRRLMEEIEDVR